MLPSLLKLHLPNCELSLIHSLSHVNFTYLTVLDISFNFFYSVILDWVVSLSNLESLQLFQSDFIGSFPNGCWSLPSLTSLDVSKNNLSSSIPNFLYGISSLENLNLGSNNLQGVISSAIRNLTSILSIDLSDNSLEGRIPTSMGNLCNLEELSLSSNKLNGEVSEAFESLSGCLANSLNSDSSLSLRVSPDWIPPFHLQLIQLRNWNLGPQFPSWIKSQRDFLVLDLSNTGISDAIPSWFWNLSSHFYNMNLSYNQIYGEIPDMFPVFGRPTIYLGSNKLKGPLPRIHSALTVLDLSNNFFS